MMTDRQEMVKRPAGVRRRSDPLTLLAVFSALAKCAEVSQNLRAPVED